MRNGLFSRFGRETKGAVAIIFGVSALVLMLGIGVSIDSARLYSVNGKVRAALDAAALAGAKLLDEDGASDADVEKRARAFFYANQNMFRDMGATFGTPVVTVDRDAGKVNVAVDVTYAAAFGLVTAENVVFTPDATVIYKPKKLEFALVLNVTGSMDSTSKIGALKPAVVDMIEALHAENPAPGNVRVAIAPYAGSVNVGSTYYTAATDLAPGADTCVVERGTMPGAVVDDPPGPGRWAETSDTADNPNYGCPSDEIMPLTDLAVAADRSAMTTFVNNLTADGNTAGHIGLAWGWYMLSPNWTSVWPAKHDPRPKDEDVIKAVLLMTDDEFNTAYFGGNKNGTDYTVNHSSGDQALELCKNLRDDGYVIYTVAFDAPAAAADLLAQCAASPERALTASSGAELAEKFLYVADQLSMLRIAQ